MTQILDETRRDVITEFVLACIVDMTPRAVAQLLTSIAYQGARCEGGDEFLHEAFRRDSSPLVWSPNDAASENLLDALMKAALKP